MKAPQSNIKLFLYAPNRYFIIPNFQRPYSWTAENIDSFLSDLEEVKQGNKKHYFGSIVFVNDGDSSIIIDGQQRATTVLLMITAIYHIAQEHPEKCAYVAEQMKDEYLYNRYAKQYGSEENRIKLRAVTSDNEVFEKIFGKVKLTEDLQESKLYKAYQRFYAYFSTRGNLESYIDTLEDFEIVTIILDKDDDNPQRVFESINSTGKPLTDGDKIRNFALMLNTQAKQDHVLDTYWRYIEQSLTDANNDYITDFFRTYLISLRQAPIRMDTVYPEFKKLFAERIDADQTLESLDAFYDDIKQSIEYYKMLKFGTDEHNAFGVLADTVLIMRYLRIDLYAPYAMAVMRACDAGTLTLDELGQVFRYIKIYFSRRIVCGLLSTSVDRLFATLHRDVTALAEANQLTYVDAMAYNLLTRSGQVRLPNDTELEISIKANEAYSQRTMNVNYVLSAVDDESKESSLLKQIAGRQIKLSIEHVMPQTLTDDWRKELGDSAEAIHAKYLHGLANLTLTGYNSEYSNLPFSKKKTMAHGFNDSPLVINKTVAKYDHWTEQALQERQAWWIQKLTALWPMPQTTYKDVQAKRSVDLLSNADLTGTVPVALMIKNNGQLCTTWTHVIDAIAEYCYELDHNLYEQVKAAGQLSKWFSRDKDDFINPQEVFDSGIFLNVASSTLQKQKIIKDLAQLFVVQPGDLIVELQA